MKLKELLTQSFISYPNNIALLENDITISYSDLYKICQNNRLLLSQYTLRNERIGIIIEHNLDAVLALLSCAYSNRVYVPIDCNIPFQRLLNILISGDIKTILTTKELYPDLHAKLKNNNIKIIVLNNEKIDNDQTRSLKINENDRADEEVSENDAAYILFTSGSTGVPKGVIISHKAALSFINWSYEYIQVNSKDRVLSIAIMVQEKLLYQI